MESSANYMGLQDKTLQEILQKGNLNKKLVNPNNGSHIWSYCGDTQKKNAEGYYKEMATHILLNLIKGF